MEKLNMVKDAWKYYAIKLLAALESSVNHNKILMQCIRDIDGEMYEKVKTKFREKPLLADLDKQQH
jgi:hypothetical protein|tara:strand:- start:2944 stop:3141 length:198 start_codon:yes stop_codon:yes gene_type:complete